MTPSEKFEHELEVFRTESEAASQFFYAYLTVHAVAAERNGVYRALNEAPLFWNTSLGALQTATFIALGRVFDQKSPHNLDKVLRIAQDNRDVFSKAALGRRKQGKAPDPPSWLADYLTDVYEAKPEDFRQIRGHVKKWRKVYDDNYRDLRNKLFAHKEASGGLQTKALFAKTNIREMQRMLAFLGALHDALQQLFLNGRKPVLRPRRYSLRRMRAVPSPARGRITVQERIVHDAERALLAVSRGHSSKP